MTRNESVVISKCLQWLFRNETTIFNSTEDFAMGWVIIPIHFGLGAIVSALHLRYWKKQVHLSKMFKWFKNFDFSKLLFNQQVYSSELHRWSASSIGSSISPTSCYDHRSRQRLWGQFSLGCTRWCYQCRRLPTDGIIMT